MKIGIASDHRGVKAKEKLIYYLEKKGHSVINYGSNNEMAVDYPIYAFKVGEEVSKGNINYGILLCGSGIGMSIACNKVKGVRCAKVNSVRETKYSRLHNNANVIAMSASIPSMKMKDIIDTFLKTEFSNEERHQKRVEQIDHYGEV